MGNLQLVRALYISTCPKCPSVTGAGGWRYARTPERLASLQPLYAWEQPDKTWVVADEYYYDARTRPQLGDAEHAAAILRRHPRTPDVLLADGANLRYEFTKLGVYCRTPVKDVDEVLGRLDSNFRRHDIVFQTGTCSNTLAEFATREWDEQARLRGESIPVDGNDHGCDCTGYLNLAVVPKYTAMIESANIF